LGEVEAITAIAISEGAIFKSLNREISVNSPAGFTFLASLDDPITR